MTPFSLLLLAISTQGQAAESYPIADQLAAKLVAKYQTSSCQQLAQERQAPPNAQKQALEVRIGQQLQLNPQMRVNFVNKVAPTIVDKMIVCGFIP